MRVDEKVGHNSQGFLPVFAPHFGGIWQEVQLLIVPDHWIDDLTLLAHGDPETGKLHLQVPLHGADDGSGLKLARPPSDPGQRTLVIGNGRALKWAGRRWRRQTDAAGRADSAPLEHNDRCADPRLETLVAQQPESIRIEDRAVGRVARFTARLRSRFGARRISLSENRRAQAIAQRSTHRRSRSIELGLRTTSRGPEH